MTVADALPAALVRVTVIVWSAPGVRPVAVVEPLSGWPAAISRPSTVTAAVAAGSEAWGTDQETVRSVVVAPVTVRVGRAGAVARTSTGCAGEVTHSPESVHAVTVTSTLPSPGRGMVRSAAPAPGSTGVLVAPALSVAEVKVRPPASPSAQVTWRSAFLSVMAVTAASVTAGGPGGPKGVAWVAGEGGESPPALWAVTVTL